MFSPIMKYLFILLLTIDFVYSQFGFLDSLRVFQSPFFNEARKLAANSNYPRFSGLSNSNPSSGCNICGNPDEILYYTRLAQQLAADSNFPNFENIPKTPQVPYNPQFSNIPTTAYEPYIPPTPAPPERRPSFRYPEIKNSLNSANSRLKTIGGPKGGGLDLRYRTGK